MVTETAKTTPGQSRVFGKGLSVPGLLVAFAPEGSCTVDRCVVSVPFVIGRSSGCNLSISDDKVSKNHFRIDRNAGGFLIQDMGSTNGTFVNGAPLIGERALTGPSVIRAGRAVLVFHPNTAELLDPPPAERYGMAGSFHTGPLVKELNDAAISDRHVLLAGPSGTGKELASRALASISGGKKTLPFVAHNAARFSNEEEAATTLFGVGPKVFSGVDARSGLIEQAHKGVLFLDEVHNLPERVQRSLLRVIEDGHAARIGETTTRPVHVRFVFASNASGETRGLAHDLFARLRLVRIPPLSERVADIPEIFQEVLRAALVRHGLDETSILSLLGGEHFEALCLDGFAQDNVRGLVDLADRIATGIAGGSNPAAAISTAFGNRFGGGLVANRSASSDDNETGHYNRNKELIIRAFQDCDGNISATERLLKSQGIRCSRRWLTLYLNKWNLD